MNDTPTSEHDAQHLFTRLKQLGNGSSEPEHIFEHMGANDIRALYNQIIEALHAAKKPPATGSELPAPDYALLDSTHKKNSTDMESELLAAFRAANAWCAIAHLHLACAAISGLHIDKDIFKDGKLDHASPYIAALAQDAANAQGLAHLETATDCCASLGEKNQHSISELNAALAIAASCCIPSPMALPGGTAAPFARHAAR